jgi:hypothetical protein
MYPIIEECAYLCSNLGPLGQNFSIGQTRHGLLEGRLNKYNPAFVKTNKRGK